MARPKPGKTLGEAAPVDFDIRRLRNLSAHLRILLDAAAGEIVDYAQGSEGELAREDREEILRLATFLSWSGVYDPKGEPNILIRKVEPRS